MAKIKFKLEYPEFTNLFLSLYVLSGVDPDFQNNYPQYLESRGKQLSVKDQEYLTLFKQEVISLVQNRDGLDLFRSIILDHKIDNLIMLKRRIDKEFRVFNFTGLDKVYLYFYQRLLEDYKFFQFPILDLLSNLDKMLVDQKIIKHLEKFHKFLEQERRLQMDQHFFLSCLYLGAGEKARFERVSPNKLLFFLPIIIDNNGQVSFDFDEKLFLEEIFYQTLSLQFETRRNKFGELFERHDLDEVNFRKDFIGALHYGIYSYDVYREEMNLEEPTDFLKRTEFKSQIYSFQTTFSEKLVPVIDTFYRQRKGLDATFISQVSELLTIAPEEKEAVMKAEDAIIEELDNRKYQQEEAKETGVIFSSDKD